MEFNTKIIRDENKIRPTWNYETENGKTNKFIGVKNLGVIIKDNLSLERHIIEISGDRLLLHEWLLITCMRIC